MSELRVAEAPAPMWKRVRAALTARSSVLLLLLLLACAMTAAAVVPQTAREAMAGEAQEVRPAAAAMRALGLDRVFSTPWFGALAALFVASLSLSTLDQLVLARARLRKPPAAGDKGVECALPAAAVREVLSAEGYRLVSTAAGRSRYVRHRHGHWGNFLLHAGMTLTVLFAVTYVLTEHRARFHLASGRTNVLEPGSFPVVRGLFARPMPLPSEVNLRRVEPVFGPNDQLVDVSSAVVFTQADGTSRELRVAVNDCQQYRGTTVYQLVKYGHVFYVELEDVSGARAVVTLEMPFPEKRASASYVNEPLEGGRTLKAKYYASADRSQLLSDRPQLVLRLVEEERVVGELTLLEGESGALGPWRVTLAHVGWWTELLFEGSLGTAGIFTGFAVLLLGAVLTFFVVPREVIVREKPAGTTVEWRATRFSDMYGEERDRIVSRCGGGAVT